MTMKELSDAVLALVPKASRLDVTLCLRTCEPSSYRKEQTVELLAEISIWHSGKFYGMDAPTYEEALERFRVEMLPRISPVEPAPAMDRLAAMEPELSAVLIDAEVT